MWVDLLSDGGEDPQHQDRMEVTSLCLVLSALAVHPDRSQFFVYDRVALTCGPPGCSGGWTLQRNTSTHAARTCPSAWGLATNGSGCVIDTVYPSDSGVYWCGSELRGSNSLNITVTDSDVILQSPALPVTEGDRLTLLCACRGARGEPPPAAFFYKDGAMIGDRPAANVTFAGVSRSDEGFYRCAVPGRGESPRSWLAVRVAAEPPPPTPPPRPPVPRLACVVLLVVLLVVLHVLLVAVCAKVRRKVRGDASGHPQS
ncbi:sialoadhesin [Gasterosteus aculeatus]